MATISMRCKECGGILDVDEGKEVMFCPYCGAKELIEESDEVQIERMRIKSQERVELERIKNDFEESKQNNKQIILCGILILTIVLISVLMAVLEMTTG